MLCLEEVGLEQISISKAVLKMYDLMKCQILCIYKYHTWAPIPSAAYITRATYHRCHVLVAPPPNHQRHALPRHPPLPTISIIPAPLPLIAQRMLSLNSSKPGWDSLHSLHRITLGIDWFYSLSNFGRLSKAKTFLIVRTIFFVSIYYINNVLENNDFFSR